MNPQLKSDEPGDYETIGRHPAVHNEGSPGLRSGDEAKTSSCRRKAAFTNRLGRPVLPTVAGMVACAVLCAAAGGCADSQATRFGDSAEPGRIVAQVPKAAEPNNVVLHLLNAAEFNRTILHSDKPVLVDFYKSGCSSCIPVNGMMDTLAEEYKGRVIVARFMLMLPSYAVTSRELKDRYDVVFYPTVILFVNGRQTCRFIKRYDLHGYRKVLDEVIGVPMVQRTSLDSVKLSGN